MGDGGCVVCFCVTIVCAGIAIAAARSIICGTARSTFRHTDGVESSITLAIAAGIGTFTILLPLCALIKAARIPAVFAAAAVAIFGSAALSATLCCLCQIRDKPDARDSGLWDKSDPTDPT